MTAMSDDLVGRLRNREGFVLEGPRRLMMACEEAAKTIETKDAEIASLQTELERERSGYQLEHEAAERLRVELAASERARLIAVTMQRELSDDISKWQETAVKLGFDGVDAAIAWGEDVARLRAELAEWTDTITAVLADVRGHRRCALYPHCEAGHAAA
jgi:hypothetical protein